MNERIDAMMRDMDIHPVLLDIGASSAPPGIWDKIAGHSVYVGFDPDRRSSEGDVDELYYRADFVPDAVTCKTDDQLKFYLTSKPHCSSTLHPDNESLSEFLFADFFRVVSETTVRAAAYDAITNATAKGLTQVREIFYQTVYHYSDFAAFKENVIRIEPRRRDLFEAIESALGETFDRLGVPEESGIRFEQPMRVNLLTKT